MFFSTFADPVMDSERDYQIHSLFPLTTDSSDFDSTSIARRLVVSQPPRHTMYGRRGGLNDAEELNRLERAEERAVERRAYIYREKLFAKVRTSCRSFQPPSNLIINLISAIEFEAHRLQQIHWIQTGYTTILYEPCVQSARPAICPPRS
jgi:hypothetical protein